VQITNENSSTIARSGYRVTSKTEQQIEFTRTYRSPGTWIATILVFPIGLIFFFAFKRIDNITMFISDTPTGRTDVVMAGQAPARLAEWIHQRLTTDFSPRSETVERRTTPQSFVPAGVLGGAVASLSHRILSRRLLPAVAASTQWMRSPHPGRTLDR
jgi:hypothetical protein